jgi:catechol 2,3-dioxygenase-like lactoylglutathione lyase family enzyme
MEAAMRLEHVGILVKDAFAMADWYEKHLGFRTLRKGTGPVTSGVFVTDDAGKVALELITHKEIAAPDYAGLSALQMHLAIVSVDPDEDRTRLEKVGATFIEETPMAQPGEKLYLMRDPWGVALQLIKRNAPLVD